MFGAMKKYIYIITLLFIASACSNPSPVKQPNHYPDSSRIIGSFYFGMTKEDYERTHSIDANSPPSQGGIYIDSARFDGAGKLYWISGKSLNMLSAEYYNGRLLSNYNVLKHTLDSLYGPSKELAPYPSIETMTNRQGDIYYLNRWERGGRVLSTGLTAQEVMGMTYDIALVAEDGYKADSISQHELKQKRLYEGLEAGDKM